MSSSPPRETWRELVEQWIAGTHAALEMVTPFGAGAFVLPFDLAAAGLFVLEAPFVPGAVAPGTVARGAVARGAVVPGAVVPADGAEAPPTPPLALVEAYDPAGNWMRATQAAHSASDVMPVVLARRTVAPTPLMDGQETVAHGTLGRASAAAFEIDRLWTVVLATNHPSGLSASGIQPDSVARSRATTWAGPSDARR